MNALMIAGTDTDAGKTVLMAALMAYVQQHGQARSIALFKPFQCGEGDRELYTNLFPLTQTLDELNPVYFSAPLAPPIAAALEGRSVPIEPAWRTFQALTQRYEFVLVEGLGGLGSPVTFETTVADLAADWKLPIVLVVPVKLGAIGQVVANVALAERSGLTVKGIVRNCVTPCRDQDLENWANQDLIERLTGIQVLGTLPHLDSLENLEHHEKLEHLAKIASNLDLELLIPRLI
jgi:dethiobiotin synthetase